jgi:Co/Zn/Cd efflux system component
MCNVVESDNETGICDLHIWQVGVNQFAAIISVVTHQPRSPQFYKDSLREQTEFAHLTVEVNACTED